LGARYDWVWIGMDENKKPYDITLSRNAKHDDWSASAGFNYLVRPNTAVYANVTRAFRAPDYTAYTSLEWVSFTNRAFLRAPGGINKNENILNTEIGYRTTIKDFSFDVAAFYTKINNRLASIFENGIVVSKPFGSNRIYGSEISISYFSSAIKGLSIRTNVTLQKAEFVDFKLPVGRGGVLGNATTALNVDPAGNLYGNKLIDEGGGNYSLDLKGKKLPGVPSLIWNSSINYSHKYFGLDFSSNVNANRYADPTQVIKYESLVILNAGAYLRLPCKGKQEVRLGAQVKNLGDNREIQNIAGLSASDLALGQKQKTPFFVNAANVPIWGQGYVQLPQRWLVYLSFDF
jgi:outer membrane receptor protein involved in Fe transport